MKHRRLGVLCAVLLAGTDPTVAAQSGPFARISVLHPRDGHTIDFEAGYIRHLAWHQQAGDTWVWYGWNVTFGERQRWFVYATFGHSAADFDSPVAPADDERDNVLNVAPHVDSWSNALYEYLPGLSAEARKNSPAEAGLSRGPGAPQPTARLELTTVDLNPGAAQAFEAALSAGQSTLQGETLWYRMVAGGGAPRYVRLRPRPSLSAVVDGRSEQALPDKVSSLIAKTTTEILTLRPTLSYGLSPARQ